MYFLLTLNLRNALLNVQKRGVYSVYTPKKPVNLHISSASHRSPNRDQEKLFSSSLRLFMIAREVYGSLDSPDDEK